MPRKRTTSREQVTPPFVYCACGCGQKTLLAPQTETRNGNIAGQPQRYAANHNAQHRRERGVIATAVVAAAVQTTAPAHQPHLGPCLEYPTPPSREYGRVGIKGRRIRVSRLIWEDANGPIPAGMVICHRCDNPRCIRLDHLFMGTIADNNRDAARKGRFKGRRHVSGVENPKAVVNPTIVRAIRAAYAAGATMTALAPRYGIDRSTVGQIVRRRTWTHVD